MLRSLKKRSQSKLLAGTPEWFSELAEVWSVMTHGLNPICIVPLLACFLINVFARLTALRRVSIGSAKVSELVSFVYDCEEITANMLMLVCAFFGLHALRSESLKNLAEFEYDVRGVCRSVGDCMQTHRRNAWESVLTEGHSMSSLFRVLAVAPMIQLLAIAMYVNSGANCSPSPCEWPPPSFGMMCGNFANAIFGSVFWSHTNPYEVFLCVAYGLTVAQVSTAAIMGARVFHTACERAIAATVKELDLLCEEHYEAGKLGLVLVHHAKLSEEMRVFWGGTQAGIALASAMAVVFSFSVSGGINLLFLVAAPPSVSSTSAADMQLFLPNLAEFFLGAGLLLFLLSYLATITYQSTSTQPHAKSIVAAMRRYVTHCLSEDSQQVVLAMKRSSVISVESTANTGDRTRLSAADRNELLSAGAMVEKRTLGVQLLGFIEMKYSLVITTFLRLVIYAPAGFSFLTTFLSHSHGSSRDSHGSSRDCQHCERFNDSALWNCTGCFVAGDGRSA